MYLDFSQRHYSSPTVFTMLTLKINQSAINRFTAEYDVA